MSNSTISTFELFELFPDVETARTYLEGRRWPKNTICPYCDEEENITTRKDGYYRCNTCKQDFTVRTGTIFERSHVPLHKWLYAMYLILTARKGISSVQLSKEIGVTQKTAWFMLQRIREACGNDDTMLTGVVEIDETFVGGKERNKHESKKQKLGRGAIGKTAVIGMKDSSGRTKAQPIGMVTAETVDQAVTESIKEGSTLHTDEHSAYLALEGRYGHATVNHGAGEYSRKGVTTNGVESMWATFKRGVYGVYHHVSPEHLHRYVNEFTFRLNEGDVKRHTLQRLASLVDATVGARITYKELIA